MICDTDTGLDLTRASDSELLVYALYEIPAGIRMEFEDEPVTESVLTDQELRELLGFDDETIRLVRMPEEQEAGLASVDWFLSSIARSRMEFVNQYRDYRPHNTKVSSKNMPGLDWSRKQNWVDKKGVVKKGGKGLPVYIDRLARQFTYAKGFPRSKAIQWAVGIARRWCRTGYVRKGGSGDKGKLNAGSRAQACAAIQQWETMKSK